MIKQNRKMIPIRGVGTELTGDTPPLAPSARPAGSEVLRTTYVHMKSLRK